MGCYKNDCERSYCPFFNEMGILTTAAFLSLQLSKVVNEVYHQYNRHQYPFIVLKISAQKGTCVCKPDFPEIINVG